jgi:hypothetical protein
MEPRTESSSLTLVCAWCDTTIHHGNGRLSHGICVDCAEKVMAEAATQNAAIAALMEPGRRLIPRLA